LASDVVRKENDMRKTIFVLAFAMVMGLIFFITEGNAQMGMMGGGMMGNGITGGGQMGRGMGSGMGNPGYGNQYIPQPPQNQQPQKQLGEKDVRGILEDYLKSKKNPNLKLGKIKDDGYAFEAEIVTKDNSLVDRILVDKNTGTMRSAY
jgi:hypothetical protein